MTLRYAYNSNGTVHHRMDDAVALIADSGYDGVALTLDHHYLDPMQEGWRQRAERLSRDLAGRRLGSVIETGARFLLDPRRRHQPTMLSAKPEERALRVEFLKRSLDIGAILGSETMSFWSGTRLPDCPHAQAMRWLEEGVGEVLEHAERVGVVAAMEPEPELLIETLDDFRAFSARWRSLGLALDLGHVMVTGERVPQAAIGEFAERIATISLEDMRRGKHVHLAFGDGDMDIPACLAALEAIEFRRLVCVELSSDSHRADEMVPRARAWIEACRR